MPKNKDDLIPDSPEIITRDIEVISFFNKMDPKTVIEDLIKGNYVLLEDFYYNGLQVLEELKKNLSQAYKRDDFNSERQYRFAYRKASNRLLVMIIEHKLAIRKAPHIGWLKILYPRETEFLISFPKVQGLNSSWQWYKKGLDIKFLNLKIHPFYGTYFPTRFDHLELFNNWLKNYKGAKQNAFDIGVGCGVLSFQLLLNGFSHVYGTDTNKNAVIGTAQDRERLGLTNRLTLKLGDLFADLDFQVELIVFNPPWLPVKHPIERGIDEAIYYEQDLFPRFFEQTQQHLEDNGKLVLLFSNLSETVGENIIHPITHELNTGGRFKKDLYLQQSVKPSSKKTKRRNWRKNEKIELWVLTPI